MLLAGLETRYLILDMSTDRILADVCDDAAMPVVREVACKTILNRSALSDYSLNCYTGCTHRCAYCYARFMERFHPHTESWGQFVDVKINAVETLKRQLHRAQPGSVFISSACDGWQPIEARYRLTRRCCELLLERGFQISLLTKSCLIMRDFDLFRGRGVRVGVSLSTLNEHLRQLWEPGAASVPHRLEVLDLARREGLETSIMFGPLLPFLSDSQVAIDGLLQQAAESGVDAIWVDAMNARRASGPPWPCYCRRTSPNCFLATVRSSLTLRREQNTSPSFATALTAPRVRLD